MDSLGVAVEQYLFWQNRGMTYHEMIVAVGGEWYAGMTGDDVVVSLTQAWQALVPPHPSLVDP